MGKEKEQEKEQERTFIKRNTVYVVRQVYQQKESEELQKKYAELWKRYISREN